MQTQMCSTQWIWWAVDLMDLVDCGHGRSSPGEPGDMGMDHGLSLVR